MRAWLCCVFLGGCHWAFGIDGVAPDAFVEPPPPGRWTSVATGARHVCAIDTDQRLFCWGDDRHGQIGTGVAPTTPQQVDGSWLAVATGPLHTCGLQSDGKAWCWGYNPDGQTTGAYGSDTMAPRLVPMPVTAPAFETLTAGLRHTCALGAGKIYCWGDPEAIGSNGVTPMPAAVASAAVWKRVSAGYDHTCAIDAAGGLWCWGHNFDRQLGTPGAATVVPTMVGLPGGAVALQVSAGTLRTCAVIALAASATTGQIWCWGRDGGVIGTATSAPQQVIAGDDWSAVTTGNSLACGVRGGKATCWGTAHHGGLGDGLWEELVPPTTATRTFTADAIAIGVGAVEEENLCALTQHDLACWGDNRGGQLGSPATMHLAGVAVPQPAAPWHDVWVGTTHTCARDVAGGTWCWGADDGGQVTAKPGLGVGAPCTTTSCDQPSPVPAPVAVTGEVVAGTDFTCGHSASSFDCWGSNAGGALQDPDATTHLHHGTLGTNQALIGGGPAVCDYGPSRFECWGTINGGRQAAPTDLTGGLFVGTYAVAFGDRSSCAVVAGNARVCWGYDYWAEFGDGVPSPNNSPPAQPTRIADATMYNQLGMTSRHVCARTTIGGIACWGSDYVGETGQASGDPVNSLTLLPTPVGGLTSCTAVAAAYDASCAICGATAPACWGLLASGRLGRDVESGAADYRPAPVVMPTASTWTGIGIGAEHACAVAMDGTLACWGLGVRGQLGDGGHGSTVPVPIGTP